MRAILKDFKYTLRSLSRGPWMAIAILELALGLGANVVIFSVINSLYLQPLPFSEPDRLVQVQQITPEETSATFGGERYLFWQEFKPTSLDSLTAYDAQGYGFKVRSNEGTEVITGARASGDFFRVFGVPPKRGRAFSPADDEPGAPLVVVLSHRLWEQKFGGDPDIIGQRLTIDEESAEIIGVMGPSFRYPENAELWAPLRIEPDSRASILRVSGRLAPTVSSAQAFAQLDAVDREYRELEVGEESPEKIGGLALQEFLYGDLRPALLILLAAVGLVLLIACANAANLQLARSATRQRELAIRIAVGARPGQIGRLLLVESLTLTLLSGVLGFLICVFTLGPILSLAPPEVQPQLAGIELDLTVFGFALALSLITGLIVGLLPARQARRTDVQEVIQEESTGSGTGGSKSGWRMRYGMVALEIALALILMISAGLLVKSFAGLRSTSLGFETERLLTLKAHPTDRYASPDEVARLERQILPKIEAMPGARQAALATSLPLELGADMPFVIQDGPEEQRPAGIAQYRGITSGYFETLGIQLLRGRHFTQADRQDAPLVAVINQAAADRFFPDGDAIGRRIVIGLPDMPQQADPTTREIIGIVPNVREAGLESEPPAILYVPLTQIPESLNALLVKLLPLNLIVRTETDPSSLGRQVHRAIWEHDPDLTISSVASMDAIVSKSTGSQSFQMILIGALAALALVLSILGTYTVLTYLVRQRTRELGVRIALGGNPGRITAMVVRQGMAVVLIGIACGIFGAWISTRLFASFLFGVSASDLTTFVLVALLMVVVAFIATLIPARHAAKISPMEALRCP